VLHRQSLLVQPLTIKEQAHKKKKEQKKNLTATSQDLSVQSFRGDLRERVYIRTLVRMNEHAYMSICVYIMIKNISNSFILYVIEIKTMIRKQLGQTMPRK